MSASAADAPLIILGAARSGTKMLRSAIAAHAQANAVPFDINFIWKYRNYGLDHDELTPADLSPGIVQFIRAFHRRFQGDRPLLVEKTVSNTVRVEFVRAVFPRCRFIHLVRDGRDVAASSRLQWQAPMGNRRVLEKLRYLPLTAAPRYALSYGKKYALRALRNEQALSSWGVEIDGLRELVATRSTLEVCGLQWRRSIECTYRGLEAVSPDDQIEVRYEALVREPKRELERIMAFLGFDMDEGVSRYAETTIRGDRQGRWRTQLDACEAESLLGCIGPALRRTGYLDAR